VQELCEAIDSENNLRVIASTTLLLYYLTGENFRPLEIDSVRKWWLIHKNEPKYKSPYKSYFKALRYIKRGISTDTKKREVIALLDKTIDVDSKTIHARCFRGGFYSLLGEDDKANEDFEYVKNYVNEFKQWLQKNRHPFFHRFENYEYKWLFFWQAASLVKQGKINDAVNSLKKALEIDPKLESDLKDYANKFEEFKTIKENLKVR
jgi:tetratricopeptide (TPR) repeat protein